MVTVQVKFENGMFVYRTCKPCPSHVMIRGMASSFVQAVESISRFMSSRMISEFVVQRI